MIKPVWTYGLQLWESLIKIISEAILTLKYAPNWIIHRDTNFTTVQKEIRKISVANSKETSIRIDD